MALIDPIYISTVFIEMFQNQNQKGSATGFFYIQDEQLYLVTNKHVIYGDKFFEKTAKSQVNKFKLFLHTNAANLRENQNLEIDLIDNDKNVWFEHSDPKIDVVVIPVKIDRTKFVIAPADKSLLDTDKLVINFEKIFVMGYPYGWFDRENNLPITRIGHLSSPFEVPFAGNPIMLGDVETHKGMSGGPVFMELSDYMTVENNNRTKHIGQSKRILVGIHSGQPLWQLRDVVTNELKEEVKHTLINIWFAKLIPEIISNHI